MARNTGLWLRNSLIYCVYVRNHGKTGTFADVNSDLARIKELGADYIWLLPVHPIGEVRRKGSLGSPYSIQDYRGINPEYGTLQDFEDLVRAIHAHGMRCMIDVVYNHTSYDSVLMREHPEWFYRDKNGNFGNRAGEWSDVADLDYTHEGLWEYQIETLRYWASLGVDGFRCDVASLVPVEFWQAARAAVEEVRPGVVWLAESVHTSFLEQQRYNGFDAYSDSELYTAFDITYDYDIHAFYEGVFCGRCGVQQYLSEMRRQEGWYPQNFMKLRFLENHDQPRAAKLLPDEGPRRMWTAFMYFVRGTALLYAGQEAADANLPSLFERDPVNWRGMNAGYIELLRTLRAIKTDELIRTGRYSLRQDEGCPSVAKVEYAGENERLFGLFNLEMQEGSVAVDLPDGEYQNLVDERHVQVKGGRVRLGSAPVILRCARAAG